MNKKSFFIIFADDNIVAKLPYFKDIYFGNLAENIKPYKFLIFAVLD
jgi:hypothetical protein